jgi:hypothetical protein
MYISDVKENFRKSSLEKVGPKTVLLGIFGKYGFTRLYFVRSFFPYIFLEIVNHHKILDILTHPLSGKLSLLLEANVYIFYIPLAYILH